MAKKMYDILPPQKKKKAETGIKYSMNGKKPRSARKTEKVEKIAKIEKTEKKPIRAERPQAAERVSTGTGKIFSMKNILIATGVLAVILCGVFYFKLQKVDVEILMKTETVSFEDKITADASKTNVVSEDKIIPAEYIEEVKDETQEFSATGKTASEGKAKGSITVYNKYTPVSPLTLKVGTHFLSDSGKYFISTSRIVIPAAKIQSGKTIPGSVEVEVVATEAGEDYNIKASNFSVPKLTGTAYYYSVYAESKEAMVGGFSEPKVQVTADDLKNANSDLTVKLLSDVETSLKNKISANPDYILLDGAILKSVVETSASAKQGAIIEKFNQTAKVKASALVIKKSDLEAFAKEFILSQISDSKTVLNESLAFDYSLDNIDAKNNTMTVNLKFTGKGYLSVDQNKLISLFKKRSAGEIKETINNNLGEEAAKIEVKFWPFWTMKAPYDTNKIKIILSFE
jgi:hypothetical protein